jgi:hypothetical protein
MIINPKQTALNVLTDELCRVNDDAYRAQRTFRLFSHKQMNEEYGQSGCTPQQLLDEYGKRLQEVITAMEWVKNHD